MAATNNTEIPPTRLGFMVFLRTMYDYESSYVHRNLRRGANGGSLPQTGSTGAANCPRGRYLGDGNVLRFSSGDLRHRTHKSPQRVGRISRRSSSVPSPSPSFPRTQRSPTDDSPI